MTEEQHRFGQLEVQTLDQVAPRLRSFVADLIEHLQAIEIELEFVDTFLLNSSHHPITVPSSMDGIPVECFFTAVLPRWSNTPRVRFHVGFNYGTRNFWTETKKTHTLPLNKVLRHFLEQRQFHLDRMKEEEEQEKKNQTAQSSVQTVVDTVEIKGSNTKIRALPDTPTLVGLTVHVTPEQAIEIITKYER